MTGKKVYDLKERTFKFAKAAVSLVKELPKNTVNDELGRQFLKAATSVGANYREADGAESKKDFIHKVAVVKKEAKESLYWVGLIKEANDCLDEEINWLINEARELSLIFSKMSLNLK